MVSLAKVEFSKGNSSSLSGKTVKDGSILYTKDTTKLYIDDNTDRVLINPNPDWNASSGNAQILNKPPFNYIVVDGTTIFVEGDSQDLPDPEPVEEETNYGVFPVIGTHSSATNLWTGNLDVSSLYDGLTIAYYVPYGGNGSDITLNLSLNSGFNSGRVNVYYDGTTRARSQIKPGSTVILTYWSAGSISVEGVDTEDERWTRVDYCIDSVATSSANGLMSSTDKSKLDSINITYTSSNKLITFSF